MQDTSKYHEPVFYWTALGLTGGEERAEVKKAYAALASNGMHPDHGGDAELWKLLTAAYNELNRIFSHKRGMRTNSTDLAWLRNFEDLRRPATRPTEPKAAGTDEPKASKKAAGSKTNDGWVFEEREGESKDDRRKRYARERQQYRYASDPDFAAARREASLKSHAKKAARDKAAKAAASAPAA